MPYRRTTGFRLTALLAVGAMALNGARVMAQGAGGFQMPPEIKAKIAKWQKWGESHKSLTNLNDMIYQVGEVEKDPGTSLNKKQASSLLKIIKSWQPKTTMSEDEAKSVSKKIGALMTEKQLKKMSTIETPSQKMRKASMGGGSRPAGPRPAAGGFKFPDPPAKGWNPFNPDSLPFEQMRPASKARLNELMGSLQKA